MYSEDIKYHTDSTFAHFFTGCPSKTSSGPGFRRFWVDSGSMGHLGPPSGGLAVILSAMFALLKFCWTSVAFWVLAGGPRESHLLRLACIRTLAFRDIWNQNRRVAPERGRIFKISKILAPLKGLTFIEFFIESVTSSDRCSRNSGKISSRRVEIQQEVRKEKWKQKRESS